MSEQLDTSFQVSKKRNKQVTLEGKNEVLCIIPNHALSGTEKAAIWWCEFLTNTLTNHGFKITPHDYYATNAFFNEKQHNVTHHVDDTKMSHYQLEIVESVLKVL